MKKFREVVNSFFLPAVLPYMLICVLSIGMPCGMAAPASFVPTEENAEPEYVLDVGDEIEIAVWRNEELSRSLTIRPDGRISMPLAGELRAAGRTPAELSRVIELELRQKYILRPEVTVIVKNISSKEILILGEVRNPGIYVINKKLTALKAIALAGGNNKFGHLESTVVIRNPEAAKPNMVLVDLKRVLKEGESDKIVLHPGDIVYVPRSFIGKMDDLFGFFARNIKPLVDTYWLSILIDEND